jgi:hypothetical protein
MVVAIVLLVLLHFGSAAEAQTAWAPEIASPPEHGQWTMPPRDCANMPLVQ